MFSVLVSRSLVLVVSLLSAVSVTAQVEVPEGLEPILIDGFEEGNTEPWHPDFDTTCDVPTCEVGPCLVEWPYQGDPTRIRWTFSFAIITSVLGPPVYIEKFSGIGAPSTSVGLWIGFERQVGKEFVPATLGVSIVGFQDSAGSLPGDTPTHWWIQGIRVFEVTAVFHNFTGFPGNYRARVLGITWGPSGSAEEATNIFASGAGCDSLVHFVDTN